MHSLLFSSIIGNQFVLFVIWLYLLVQLDDVDEAANEKEDNGKMEDIDCNHDIRIHEDLGHVCRVCGMIVRRADSIIDYQWKKVRNLFKIYEAFLDLVHFAIEFFMHACSFCFVEVLKQAPSWGVLLWAKCLAVNFNSLVLLHAPYNFKF